MFMEIPKLTIRFIDSFNFLQMPLKSFPKTFGMDELKKGWFPHYFNKMFHKNYIGSIPSKKLYGYNQMKPKDHNEFLKWYKDHIRDNYFFDFHKEIIKYWRSDVDILGEDFTQLENIHPLCYIMTASVCMTIYHSNYMPKKPLLLYWNMPKQITSPKCP